MSTITPNVVKLCIARSGFRATKSKYNLILTVLYDYDLLYTSMSMHSVIQNYVIISDCVFKKLIKKF